MCGWTGHIQGNLPLRVCEAVRPSARFGGKFCPQEDIRGKEFLSRDSAQKWVPPKAWRFCDTLRAVEFAAPRLFRCLYGAEKRPAIPYYNRDCFMRGSGRRPG